MRHDRQVPAHIIIDESTQNAWLLRAVCSETAVHGLVAVNIGSGSRATIEIKTRRVEAILEEVSLTLQRIDIEKAMEDARLRLQAQLLRDAFHGTLSHELCSPLAAIQGSASVLGSMPLIRQDRSGSLAGRSHLRRSRGTRRLHSKPPQRDARYRRRRQPTPRMGRSPGHRQCGHPAKSPTIGPPTRSRPNSPKILPLINVDSGLIEESCGQLLENAAKYSPSGSTISVAAKAEQGTRHFVDFRSGRRNNAGRTATPWPQVISQPTPSGHHSRIRSRLLDRIHLCQGKRRHHRHFESVGRDWEPRPPSPCPPQA